MLATVALGAAHWPLGARAGAPPACRVPCAPQRRPLCGSCMRRHRAAAAQAGQSTSGSVDAGVRIKLACGAARGTAARGNTAQRAVREVAGSRRLLCLQRAAGLSEHLIDLPAAGWDRAARAAQAWRWAPSSATCWRRRSRCSAASLRGGTSPRRPSRLWAAACSWCLPWPPRSATSEQAGWLCRLWVTSAGQPAAWLPEPGTVWVARGDVSNCANWYTARSCNLLAAWWPPRVVAHAVRSATRAQQCTGLRDA